MEIYVSDDIYEYLTIGKRDIHSGVDDDLVVKNLEQHEQEIRKPLEDEIVSLKKYIPQLEYWKSYWYNSYDEIRNKYNKNQQVKQERQEVIAELEEWFFNKKKLYKEVYSATEFCVTATEIEQKLNEMKGE